MRMELNWSQLTRGRGIIQHRRYNLDVSFVRQRHAIVAKVVGLKRRLHCATYLLEGIAYNCMQLKSIVRNLLVTMVMTNSMNIRSIVALLICVVVVVR